MNTPWRGVFPPLVTPLLDRDQLDLAAQERQVERVIAGGVAGIFILGSTGEAPSLSLQRRKELVRETCRLVRGRVPVLVGITDTCLAHSLEIAGCAADQGAQATVLTVPYYFPPDQAELEALARTIVRESPLPLFLYNIPVYTKAAFGWETVRRLLDEERIIGLKDSSGDMAGFLRLCELTKLRPGWTLLMGPEDKIAAGVAAGGHGGVPGGALIHPKLFVEICRAALAGDQPRVAVLQRQVESLGRIYRVSDHGAGVFKAIKCALSLLGVCRDRMAEPLLTLNETEREQIRRILEECELLPARQP